MGLHALILLIILITFVCFIGCITHFRKPITEAFENNFYIMWENEIKSMDFVNMPPGVIRIKKNEEDCNAEGIQLVQNNVAFKPSVMDDKCTKIERVWPGQLI